MCRWRASSADEGLDRHDGECAPARLPAAGRAARGAGRRGRDHGARVRPDAAADRAARHEGDGDRAPRRPVAARQGATAHLAPAHLEGLGEAPRLRRRAGARIARADDHSPPARDPELDDLRLRVRLAAARARLPRSDEGRRPGVDPARAPRPLRRTAPEAARVPRAEGGVLPLGLRPRPEGARRVAARPGAHARRAPAAARRLALPPALESALPADAAAPRAARHRARDRDPAHGRAARLCPLAGAAVGDRPGAGGRRAEPDRVRRPRRLGRRNDEPRGGRARRARLHDLRRAGSGAWTRS